MHLHPDIRGSAIYLAVTEPGITSVLSREDGMMVGREGGETAIGGVEHLSMLPKG